MSTVAPQARMTLREAEFQASVLYAHLEDVCERHAVAGSVRRMRGQNAAEIGDIDHVLIPKLIVVPAAPSATAPAAPGLFGEIAAAAVPAPVKQASAVRLRIEQLIQAGTGGAKLSVKTDGKTRFGPRYISLEFNRVTHELWMTEPDRWGCTLLVRTGSDNFSHSFVTRLRRYGYRTDGGRLIRLATSHERYDATGDPKPGEELLPCPDELTFFRACGYEAVIPPEQRDR